MALSVTSTCFREYCLSGLCINSYSEVCTSKIEKVAKPYDVNCRCKRCKQQVQCKAHLKATRPTEATLRTAPQ